MSGNKKADKVVIITGGNYGIGLAIATHLASIGNNFKFFFTIFTILKLKT